VAVLNAGADVDVSSVLLSRVLTRLQLNKTILYILVTLSYLLANKREKEHLNYS